MGDLTPGWKFGETRESLSLARTWFLAASLITNHPPPSVVLNLDLLHTLYVCTWELCGLFFLFSLMCN